jgi:hypothetical protein
MAVPNLFNANRNTMFAMAVLACVVLHGEILDAGDVRCIGWAAPGVGELDIVVMSGKLGVIWGPPIEQLVGPPVPSRESSTDGTVTFAATRAGVVRGVGAWLVNRYAQRPSGFFGAPSGGFLPVGATPRLVHCHPREPSLPRLETVWSYAGASFQRDLRLFADGTAVISGNELWLPFWKRDRPRNALEAEIKVTGR